jgi:predicted MFS family arabinose efflux permease
MNRQFEHHKAAVDDKSKGIMVNIASGLSAWLGGVAFCAGVGLTAPTWVAAPLTVLSVGIAAITGALVRRNKTELPR